MNIDNVGASQPFIEIFTVNPTAVWRCAELLAKDRPESSKWGECVSVFARFTSPCHSSPTLFGVWGSGGGSSTIGPGIR